MEKRLVSISIGNFQTRYGDKEALRIAKEIGADGVDFNLLREDCRKEGTSYFLGEAAVRQYYKELKKYADELGIKIVQTHGRISGFKNIPEEDDILVQNGILDCIATAALGSSYCVMHTTTSIYMGPNPDRDLMQMLNFEMYRRILPFAKREGIKIATETFGDAVKYNCIDFFGDIEEFVEGYERVAALREYREHFCVCMDPGHSNKATRFHHNPTPANVIRRLGSAIEVLHLNDNDTVTDQHKIPMMGCIDWQDLLDALEEIGYSGYYNMEIALAKPYGADFDIEYARFAIKAMRHILKTRYGEESLTSC